MCEGGGEGMERRRLRCARSAAKGWSGGGEGWRAAAHDLLSESCVRVVLARGRAASLVRVCDSFEFFSLVNFHRFVLGGLFSIVSVNYDGRLGVCGTRSRDFSWFFAA